jgi:transposase-like protein
LLPQHPRRRTGCDAQIRALSAQGLTPRDRQDLVKDLYGVDVAPTRLAESTADRDTAVTAGRPRRRDPVWPLVSRDGLVVPVRGDNARGSEPTRDVASGVHRQGKQERWGWWRDATAGAQFWLSGLTDWNNRGRQDSCIAGGDGRTGFPAAIRTASPPTKGPLGRVPLVRAALRYGTDRESKAVARDLQKISPSATGRAAEPELATFAAAWGAQGPTSVNQGRLQGSDRLGLLDDPPAMRQALDTTNGSESVTSVLRKYPRNRKQDSNGESALQWVDRAIHAASKTWTLPIVGWQAALKHLAILFAARRPEAGKKGTASLVPITPDTKRCTGPNPKPVLDSGGPFSQQ